MTSTTYHFDEFIKWAKDNNILNDKSFPLVDCEEDWLPWLAGANAESFRRAEEFNTAN